jgi:hypothetical protein
MGRTASGEPSIVKTIEKNNRERNGRAETLHGK